MPYANIQTTSGITPLAKISNINLTFLTNNKMLECQNNNSTQYLNSQPFSQQDNNQLKCSSKTESV